jgi:alkylation response protein AidB-like acyl-CoA dehydrogenase
VSEHAPDPTGSLEATARAFRAWLGEHAAELEPFRHEHAEDVHLAVARFSPLQRILWDAGWTRLGWTSEFGGLGGPPVQRFGVIEGLTREIGQQLIDTRRVPRLPRLY